MTRERLRFWMILGLLVAVLLFPALARAQEGSHIVRWGENLTRIAWQYDVTVEELVAANGDRKSVV